MSRTEWSTTLTELGNGAEQRIANWADGRVKFDAALGIRSLTDLRELISFHRRRKGRAFGFLVRDLLDYEVAVGVEGAFAEGNGTAGPFLLTKTYYDAENSDARPIYKPEEGTVKIYVDGIEQTAGTHYTLNYKTGRVTFLAGYFPASGAVLEWEGRFFVPVRFVEDELPADEIFLTMKPDSAGEYVVADGSAEIPPILMIEIRDFE